MEREMHTRQAGERREGRCGGAGDARGGGAPQRGQHVCRAWCRGRPGRQTQSRSLFAALACLWAKQTNKQTKKEYGETKQKQSRTSNSGTGQGVGQASLALALARFRWVALVPLWPRVKYCSFYIFFLSPFTMLFLLLLASLALLFNLAPLDVLFFFSRRAPWRRCRSGRRWGQQRARARPRRRRRARGRA